MTSYVTPKKNTAFRFYVSLASQSSTHTMQGTPTLAAGDVKVSTDGGALANLTTLPAVTPAASKLVQVDLSAAEMNGDNITIIFSDAAGSEWDDLVINLQTTARQIDDLAYPTVSGRSLDVTATGAAGIDWANVENPTTTLNLSGTNIDADQVVASVSGAVGSVTGAVGSVTGAVGSVASGGITAASFAANALDAVWSVATRLLTAGTNIVLAKGTGVTGFNDLDASGVRGAVGLATANLDTQLGDLPTAAETTDAVWDELLSGHVISGSTGAGLSAAGAAGDPWSTALPGAYNAGEAGYIVGTNLDATVGGRASQASVNTIDDLLDTEIAAILAVVDTEVAAIKAKTDLIPASPAAVSDIPTAIQNADALLDRNMATGTDSGSATVRTLRQALRLMRNKFTAVGTTLTVYKEDDTTVAWTSTLTTDSAADPVTASDPASS